jgi:hypothetical protein
MASSNAVEKIKIVKLNESGAPVDGIVCMYNPTKLVYKRSTQWQKTPLAKKTIPSYAFKGVGPAALTVELLFDTTLGRGPVGGEVKDVKTAIEFLLSLTRIDQGSPKKDRPPYCRLIWGMGGVIKNQLYFDKGVATSVSVTYEMFAPDGTPIRAKANVTFEEVLTIEQVKPQNPTSRSEARKVWVVEEGQTLDWIAYQEYGDPGCWRHIAETNDLVDPRELRSGQVLRLVPLP